MGASPNQNEMRERLHSALMAAFDASLSIGDLGDAGNLFIAVAALEQGKVTHFTEAVARVCEQYPRPTTNDGVPADEP